MSYGLLRTLVVGLLLAAGCTTQTSVPATTPSTISPGTTTSTVLTTTTTSDSVESQSEPGNTPPDSSPGDEVLIVMAELEERRVAALNSQDEASYAALFADTPYRSLSLEAFESIGGTGLPVPSIRVIEVDRYDRECIAFTYTATNPATGEVSEDLYAVLTPSPTGWLYAYTTQGGSDWTCDGPHPLDSR